MLELGLKCCKWQFQSFFVALTGVLVVLEQSNLYSPLFPVTCRKFNFYLEPTLLLFLQQLKCFLFFVFFFFHDIPHVIKIMQFFKLWNYKGYWKGIDRESSAQNTKLQLASEV